jgi:hypothetical protein
MSAPIERSTLAVDLASSEQSAPPITEAPGARAANISERCVILLSPGTRWVPMTAVLDAERRENLLERGAGSITERGIVSFNGPEYNTGPCMFNQTTHHLMDADDEFCP